MATLPASSAAGPAAATPYAARGPHGRTLNVRPFFENKARAFWTLQAVGWGGYLLLRSVSSLSNGFRLELIIPVIVEAIVGYCTTMLLSACYGYYRQVPRIVGVPLAVVTLVVATMLYATINAFSFSFLKTGTAGVTVTLVAGSLFLNFVVLAGWSALYVAINFFWCWRTRSTRCARWNCRRPRHSWRCCAIS